MFCNHFVHSSQGALIVSILRSVIQVVTLLLGRSVV